MEELRPVMMELSTGGFIDWEGDLVRLTPRGRLLSNEVFERFLATGATTAAGENAGSARSEL